VVKGLHLDLQPTQRPLHHRPHPLVQQPPALRRRRQQPTHQPRLV